MGKKKYDETPEEQQIRLREYKRLHASKWRAAHPERVKELNEARREQARLYEREHRAEALARVKKWRADNPDRQRDAAREQGRRWRENNPEKARIQQREGSRKYRARVPHHRLKHTYGLPEEEAKRIFALLGVGPCEICGFKGQMYPDHDHKTRQYRGLLCRHCNFGLGHFRDNPELLNAAIRYLKRE